MDTLRINTSQNIFIEQAIASVGERIVATLIDLLIMASYSIGMVIITQFSHSQALMAVGMLPVMLYGLLSELIMNGQTWGKKVMKIKVIKIDGTVTSFSAYFLRWIISLVEVYAFFGSLALITIILNRKGQRIGDIAANTTIVRLNKKKVDATILEDDIPSEYQVVYPQVNRLSMKDIYIIQEVLETLKNYNSDVPRKSIAQRARAAIEQKLELKSEQKTIPFFETILMDYNFINSR